LAAIDSSSLFAIETFGLPVKDAVRGLKPEQFFCPGSLLRLTVDPASPLGFGLESEAAAFFASSSAFELLPAMSGDPAAASVAARYGTSDVLLSGWLEGRSGSGRACGGARHQARAGRVVLLGFRVQHPWTVRSALPAAVQRHSHDTREDRRNRAGIGGGGHPRNRPDRRHGGRLRPAQGDPERSRGAGAASSLLHRRGPRLRAWAPSQLTNPPRRRLTD